MCEQEKQVKLAQVYSELANIKTQLHSLMQPASHSNSSTLVKINIMQPSSNQHHKLSVDFANRGQERGKFEVSGESMRDRPDDSKGQSRNQKGQILGRPMNSPRGDAKIKEPEILRVKRENPFTNKDFIPKSGSKLGAPKQEAREVKELQAIKVMPKIKFSPEKKGLKAEGSPQRQAFQAVHGVPKRQFFHGRHNSQLEACKSQQRLEGPYEHISGEKEFVNMQSLGQKQFFVVNKNMQVLKADVTKTKRLVRMRSDFTGFPAAEPQPTGTANRGNPPLSGKVRELEQQLRKKDEVIEVLCKQLHEIQRNFRQLQSSLCSVLVRRGGGGPLRESQVNLALEEVLTEMERHRGEAEQQRGQVRRTAGECERLRRTNLVQEQRMRQCEQQLASLARLVEEAEAMKADNQGLRGQVQLLANKLEVSVGENRLKDQFIAKFLLGRNGGEGAEWVARTLDRYLKGCEYPRNRLMEKLQAEEAEIRRLRGLLSRGRTYSS